MKDDDIEMYSTHNEEKSVVAERFTRTWNTKIYKQIDKLDDTVMNLKFKVGDHVRISKYKNIFAKGYTPNCSEEVFVIKKS